MRKKIILIVDYFYSLYNLYGIQYNKEPRIQIDMRIQHIYVKEALFIDTILRFWFFIVALWPLGSTVYNPTETKINNMRSLDYKSTNMNRLHNAIVTHDMQPKWIMLNCMGK